MYSVLWATCLNVGLNGSATAWLIRRFLDPHGNFLFLGPDQVSEAQRLQGAIGFDAPGARYSDPDVDGRCSFELLVRERHPEDSALVRLARIIRDADVRKTRDHPLVTLAALAYQAHPQPSTAMAPEAPGLWAISQGFRDAGQNDLDVVNRSAFLYDSLYAHFRRVGEHRR
jgi:hypothetical protein